MIRLTLLIIVLLAAVQTQAEPISVHIFHCGESRAERLAVQVFNAGADEDTAVVTDSTGLLTRGQGIDLACESVAGRSDYCQLDVIASGPENLEITSSMSSLSDGDEYRVCADPEAGKITVNRESCDCAFL